MQRTILHHRSRHHHGHGGGDSDKKISYSQDLFAEVFSFGNLIGGASGSDTVQVQADAAFEWVKTTLYAESDGAALPISGGSLTQLTGMISDGGNGRQLFSSPMPVNMFAGDGKLPFILPVTRIFEPTSTIVIDLVNFSANKYDNIFIALWGRKLFGYQKGR